MLVLLLALVQLALLLEACEPRACDTNLPAPAAAALFPTATAVATAIAATSTSSAAVAAAAAAADWPPGNQLLVLFAQHTAGRLRASQLCLTLSLWLQFSAAKGELQI